MTQRLRLAGDSTAEGVEALIAFVRGLSRDMEIPETLQAFGVNEADFLAQLLQISLFQSL